MQDVHTLLVCTLVCVLLHEHHIQSCTHCQLARMVKRPVVSILTQQLFDFENCVSLFVHHFPGLVGIRFGELAYRFPSAIVLGLVDRDTGRARHVIAQGSSLAVQARGIDLSPFTVYIIAKLRPCALSMGRHGTGLAGLHHHLTHAWPAVRP
jgi:hypothetical protein